MERVLEVTDKFSGRVVAVMPQDDRQELHRKIGLAAWAAPLVKSMTFEERVELARRVGLRIEQEREEFTGLLVGQGGQARKFAEWEVGRAVGTALRFGELVDLVRPVELPAVTGRNILFREPYGVVGVITPRNSPLMIPFHTLFSCLGAGNGVVLRPSTLVPGPALRLVELAAAEGCPPEAVQCSTADGEDTATEFIENPRVDVFITYSNSGLGKENLIKMGRYLERSEAGQGILRTVEGKLTKYVPELAGNDPFIVLAGADLDRAVQAAVWGAFANAGQLCIAAKRLLVQREIAGAFKERIGEAAAKLKIGDPHLPDTDVGPLGRKEALDLAVEHVGLALAQGGRLLFGGRVEDPFFYPTLVEFDARRILVPWDEKPDLWREESFAPLRSLVVFDRVEEAHVLAGDTRYGLGAAIFGPPAEALSIAGKLAAGRVVINEGPLYGDIHLPVGGVRNSGLYGATHKIEEVTYQKRIHIA